MAELAVHIVSRTGVLWQGQASQVIAPATTGSVGVLPGRVPLLAALTSGRVIVDPTEGERLEFSIDDGFISVDVNQVEVVVEHGTRS